MSSYERGKAPLALMEQVIMILVFALAAAVCVEAFASASLMSREGEDLQRAQNDCQTLAEYIVARDGDWQEVKGELGGKELSEGGYEFAFVDSGMKVKVKNVREEDYLARADLEAYNSQGQDVYHRTIYWQRGGDGS